MAILCKRHPTVEKAKTTTIATKDKKKRSSTTKSTKATKRTKTNVKKATTNPSTNPSTKTKPTPGSKLKSPPNVKDATTIDLSLKLAALQKQRTTSVFLQDDTSLAAADIPPFTSNQKSRSKFLQELIVVLKSYGEKWKEMLQEVDYQMTDGTTKKS